MSARLRTSISAPASAFLALCRSAKDYLVYNGTMRFWRGVDGTKRYLVMLSYDPRARINIIDLDAPQTGVHPVAVASVPQNFGYPGSGFALGKTRGFAMHPTPDQDGSQIYEITPGAIDATWTVTPKPLNGIALPSRRKRWAMEAAGIRTSRSAS